MSWLTSKGIVYGLSLLYIKEMCISVCYGVDLFKKMYHVMKSCDKLEILKKHMKVTPLYDQY